MLAAGVRTQSAESAAVTVARPQSLRFVTATTDALPSGWNGTPDDPSPRVPSARLAMPSVQLVRLVHKAVLLVNGWPTPRQI